MADPWGEDTHGQLVPLVSNARGQLSWKAGWEIQCMMLIKIVCVPVSLIPYTSTLQA